MDPDDIANNPIYSANYLPSLFEEIRAEEGQIAPEKIKAVIEKYAKITGKSESEIVLEVKTALNKSKAAYEGRIGAPDPIHSYGNAETVTSLIDKQLRALNEAYPQ